MFTDTHCHLASRRFDPATLPDFLERAHAADVRRLVTLATCDEDFAANLELASLPGIHTCLGVHPCDAHTADEATFSRLDHLLADRRVCAVGETGLDYFHQPPEGITAAKFREIQATSLHRHFQLGARHQLGLVIHCRDRDGRASFEDAFAIYREYADQVRAVFHCFVGDLAEIERIRELGGLVSFGGVITFRNAAAVREAAIACPLGALMLETDSPYLSPEPHRGKCNEPAMVATIANFLAEARGITPQALAAATEATATGFFRFRDDEFKDS